MRTSWMTGLLALTWACACMAGGDATDSGDTGEDPTPMPTARIEQVDANMAWISRGVANACPDPEPGFRVGLLFDVDSDECNGDGGCTPRRRPEVQSMATTFDEVTPVWTDMPAPLQEFCIYIPEDPENTSPPTLQRGQLQTLVRSRMVVGRSGDSEVVDDALRTELLRKTQDHICFPDIVLQNQEPTHKIRLTLLDTEPTGAHDPAGTAMSHGAGLAYLIDDLMCQPDDTLCNEWIEVRYRNAMPLQAREGEPWWFVDEGGDFGPLDWLAQAIVREVRDWQAANATEPTRLVLNLSLAWHPDYGTPADSQAVLAALEYAACQGALVVSAVGNRTGNSDVGSDTGALFPSLWGLNPALTGSECIARGYGHEGEIRKEPIPLLYPAGGVMDTGSELMISRAQSQPSLVGYARNAMSEHGRALGMQPMSGTSVGAAMVAAAAARAWLEESDEEQTLTVMQRVADQSHTIFSTPDLETEPRMFRQEFGDPSIGQVGFDSLPFQSEDCVFEGIAKDFVQPFDCAGGCESVPQVTVLPPGDDGLGNVPFTLRYAPYREIRRFSDPTPIITRCANCGIDVANRTARLAFPDFPSTSLDVTLVFRTFRNDVYETTFPYTGPAVYEIPPEGLPSSFGIVHAAAVWFEHESIGYMSEIDVPIP